VDCGKLVSYFVDKCCRFDTARFDIAVTWLSLAQTTHNDYFNRVQVLLLRSVDRFTGEPGVRRRSTLNFEVTSWTCYGAL